MSLIPPILYPNRVFTETKTNVPGGVKYSWTWSADNIRTTLACTNPAPAQLANIRKHLKVQEGK